MPQIRYFTVDIHLQAKVSGVSENGGDLTATEAMGQALGMLQLTSTRRHGIQIASATVTETSIGGRPIASGYEPGASNGGEWRPALTIGAEDRGED